MSFDEHSAVYRMLDASLNRASEGLRTLEELARFGLDNPAMTAELKSLRHRLTAALQSIARDRLLSARDTEGDVGTSLQQPSEYRRTELNSVLQAAASRVQQSLRVLEETSKTIDASIAQSIEQIRYRSYTVCAKLESMWPKHERSMRLAKTRLYALVDATSSSEQFERLVHALCEGGVDVIQLRDRSKDDRTLIERARRGIAVTGPSNVLFIMNDRADLALAADCDGVHIGQDELPIEFARQILGANRLIGVSTHSVDQARRAETDGADYIGCGPVFPGRTKQFDDYVGTELLTLVAKEVTVPAFAIGGIDASNVAQVLDAGFHRIAVTGAIRDQPDPMQAARELKELLGGQIHS